MKTSALGFGCDCIAHIAPMGLGSSEIHVHVHASAFATLSDPLPFLHLIDEKSFDVVFSPYFFIAKLTRDSDKRSDLIGAFGLSSIKHTNNGVEASISKTA
ncbi:uncharacterized protein EDB91DRAFT_858053 [Suillus paluster]|uniref:uncharacterized protein n=1 Tax=Suillus paluster TaxID=48578 RepID=UPI001B86CDCC|nr:uncharacterized protein EDB91DRAFT_858053 [Suillus paluster]KAG1728362.1 hypothetical protein EDB91DRAFT_858053 [Suillus paluster]